MPPLADAFHAALSFIDEAAIITTFSSLIAR
jgi:hypothetical protein